MPEAYVCYVCVCRVGARFAHVKNNVSDERRAIYYRPDYYFRGYYIATTRRKLETQKKNHFIVLVNFFRLVTRRGARFAHGAHMCAYICNILYHRFVIRHQPLAVIVLCLITRCRRGSPIHTHTSTNTQRPTQPQKLVICVIQFPRLSLLF